jgi:hypothetical protein
MRAGTQRLMRMGVLKLVDFRAAMLASPAIGFALTYLVHEPGLMTLDSEFQLVQARSFEFSDWHPIIMSLIWSATNYVLAGPLGFFLLLLGMYWIGFILIAKHFYSRSRIGYVLALALPFFPLLINFSGTLWKDVLVFDCFLLSVGLMLYLRETNVAGLPIFLSITAILLIAFGVLARYNSQLAAIPLVAMLLWPSWGAHRVSTHLIMRRLVLSGALTATLFLSGSTALNVLLQPERTHPEGMLLIFDLVGISHRVGHNLLPGEWTAEQTQSILTACYEQKGWDSIWATCEFVMQKLRSEGLWPNLVHPWWKALSTYPLEYLLHRMAYLQSLFSIAIDAHLVVSDPGQQALQHSATAPLLLQDTILGASRKIGTAAECRLLGRILADRLDPDAVCQRIPFFTTAMVELRGGFTFAVRSTLRRASYIYWHRWRLQICVLEHLRDRSRASVHA